MQSTKVLTNFIWRFLERSGAQGVSFIVSIILARLLAPQAYGTVALVTVITSILQIFVSHGLGMALVQKKNADELDYSSMFFFNIAISFFLYALLFFSAPRIAVFYNMPELTALTRVLGLTLILSAPRNIQQVYVSKHMLFKRFFYATLGGTVAAAVVGVYMAYTGYGVWALVAQSLLNLTVDTLLLWFTVDWRPRYVFSLKRVQALWEYAWKILLSALIDVGYNNLRLLIIGKLYSTGELAFYNRAQRFPGMIVENINTSIDSVLFPVLAAEQDDRVRVKAMTRRAMKMSCYVIMPMMVGLAVCAENIVTLLLTNKWLPCVPFLRIFCFTYAFYPLHTANLNAIKAMGRSDLFLKLEIAKKIVGITLLLLTMRRGVMAMAYSLLFSSVIGQIINSWPNRRLLSYSYPEQIRDILPALLLSIAMGAIVYMVQLAGLHAALTLALQIPLGICVYVGGSKIFHLESYTYAVEMLRDWAGERNAKQIKGGRT